MEFDVYMTNRSKVRGFVRKLTESKSTTGAVEIDAGMARGLIRRISQLHPNDRPLPRSFSEWRRKLEEGASESSPRDCLVEDAGADWVARIESQDDSISACDRTAGRVRDSTLGRTVLVMDAAYAGGLRKVFLATVKRASEME